MGEAGTEAATAQEPSIEEILASIRRIISDDGEEAAAPEAGPVIEEAVAPAAAKPAEEFTPVEDILELTERVEDVPPPRPVVAEPAPQPAPAPTPSYRAAEEPMPRALSHFPDDDALVSEPIAQQATDYLSRVAPREVDRTDDPLPIPHRTLEEVVREMLRPMLREWLDTYLPGIVERAVERELRRISRRTEELH